MRTIDARILFVDVERNCLDAVSMDGISSFKDIKYTNTGLMKSGEIYHPEIGDVVTLEVSSSSDAKIVNFYSAVRQSEDGRTVHQVGKGNFPDTSVPGDRKWHGPDGAYLALDRGKRARVAGGPLAQTVYFGLEGLVRTICQNYEAIGSGFRVYSVNDNGEVVTRICFSSKDSFTSKGFNDNERAESENYEYQIDISKDGISLFVGKIEENGKRKNTFTTSITQDGDVIMKCGENVHKRMYANGSMIEQIVDDSNKVLYSKSITKGSAGILVKEIINGDYVRCVNGNTYEEVTETSRKKVDKELVSATVIDESCTYRNKLSGINASDVSSSAAAGIIQR